MLVFFVFTCLMCFSVECSQGCWILDWIVMRRTLIISNLETEMERIYFFISYSGPMAIKAKEEGEKEISHYSNRHLEY